MVFEMNGKERMFAFTEITFGQIVQYLFGTKANISDFEVRYIRHEKVEPIKCETCEQKIQFIALSDFKDYGFILQKNEILSLQQFTAVFCYPKSQSQEYFGEITEIEEKTDDNTIKHN